MTSFDLIALGRVGVDLYPQQQGPLKHVSTFAKSLGGSAANVAVACARLGHDVALVSRVGDDRFGEYLREELEEFGVDTRWVGTDPHLKSPITFAELDPPEDPGLEFYRWPKAPDLNIDERDLDLTAIRDAAILWVTGTGLSQQPSRDATIAAMRARGGHATTVLDLDWRSMFWGSVDEATAALATALPHATLVVGNRMEVAIALGEPGAAADEPEDLAQSLLDSGVGHAIVKLGADGVLLASEEGGLQRVEPIRVPVVCGLGAGDAFGGALCHGLLEGWEPAEIVRFANAAGAYVAARLACADAMPGERDVLELLEEHANA